MANTALAVEEEPRSATFSAPVKHSCKSSWTTSHDFLTTFQMPTQPEEEELQERMGRIKGEKIGRRQDPWAMICTIMAAATGGLAVLASKRAKSQLQWHKFLWQTSSSLIEVKQLHLNELFKV